MRTPPDNLHDLRDRWSHGERWPLLHFWGHHPRPGQTSGPHMLSQWWPGAFVWEGVTLPTAEHGMMLAKARLFGDAEIAEKILNTTAPDVAKRLGRKVRGFDTDKWEAAREEIVTSVNVAKFGQDPERLAYLLGTEDSVLIEASPSDTIWGIGLAEADPRARSPLEWRGLNLLGFALMRARGALRGG
jgi:ribA/ribD-fused uncharacterized protein